MKSTQYYDYFKKNKGKINDRTIIKQYFFQKKKRDNE